MDVIRSFESPDVRIGCAGPLLVALFHGTNNLASLDAYDRVQGELLTKHERVSTLTLIGKPGAMLKIEDAVRARSAELQKKYEQRVLGAAIVVGSTGLAAVVVRTFLSGFFLVARTERPMGSFATVRAGLTWLKALPGQSPLVKTEITPADLERFFA